MIPDCGMSAEAYRAMLDALPNERTDVCIGGCSWGMDHKFHHHPYCGLRYGSAERHGEIREAQRDVDSWFELSRANYLVLPRVLMDDMPHEWQHKFVALLEEMYNTYDSDQINDHYTVHLRDPQTKRFVSDPLANYRHPDRAYIASLRKE